MFHFRFLSKSLDSLTQTLQQNEDFKVLEREFGSKADFLKRKGVFPYTFIKSQADYNRPLPLISEFSDISEEDYLYACFIYEEFNCMNMGDYSDLYLKVDCCLLTCIFEKLRNDCLAPDTYQLDPAHFLSAPSFSWCALLKLTKVKINLISDLSMLEFIKRGIRGGLTQASCRFMEAHNHYIDSSYTGDENFLIYLDKVNLYGSAMTGPMPCGNYKWLDPQTFDLTTDAEGNEGFIVEVDCTYSESLHDFHDELPFLPESTNIGGSKKLCATLTEKKNYVVSLRNLQQAIRHGLEVRALHKVLKFDQSNWIKSYIELNNNIRRNATDKARSDLAKLMNNAVSQSFYSHTNL